MDENQADDPGTPTDHPDAGGGALPAPPPAGDSFAMGAPAAASAPAGRRVGVVVAVALAAVLLVGGAAVGAAMFALRGTGEQLTARVPADVDVFATAYLDPSASQKVNLLRMLHRFPALGSDQALESRVDQAVDEALASTGLTPDDVRPWVGSQVAVVGRMSEAHFSVAVLIDSADDAAAEAALRKLRSQGAIDGKSFTWTDVDRDGSTIWVGTPEYGGDPIVAAIEGGAVIAGNSEELVADVTATARGGSASLADSDAYQETIGSLPEERLGLAYVDVAGVIEGLEGSSGAAGASFAGPSLGGVDPTTMRALGLSVSARPDGLEMDAVGTIDPAKLGPEQRAALGADGDSRAILGNVPADAYGVITMSGLKEQIEATLSQFGGTSGPFLDQLGLTGPNGVLEHLTGDAAIEVGPGPGRYPTGAFVIGTDDPVGMQGFLDRISTLAAQNFAGGQGAGGFGPAGGKDAYHLTSTSVAAAGSRPGWSTGTYKGITVSSFAIPGDDLGIQPSYAVVSDAGIVGASPGAVKAVIDAHGGQGISADGEFQAAAATLDGMDESLFYLNVGTVTSAVRETLPPDERDQFDREIAPNLSPLRSLISGSKTDASGTRQRMVLLVE